MKTNLNTTKLALNKITVQRLSVSTMNDLKGGTSAITGLRPEDGLTLKGVNCPNSGDRTIITIDYC